MNLIKGDTYQLKFLKLLGELNDKREDKEEYNRITEKVSYLVGQMIGHIDSLEVGRLNTLNKPKVK